MFFDYRLARSTHSTRGAALLAATALLVLPAQAAFAAGKVNVRLRRLAGEFDGARRRPGLRQGDRRPRSRAMPAARVGLANQIKGKLRQGDVFVSANPKVNDGLMGAANGDWVSWYITFAQSPLVIGYNASSKFAADFKSEALVSGAAGARNQDRPHRSRSSIPRARSRSTLMKQAETFYKSPGLSEKVLGAPDNPAQVLPEETLVGRLQSGQLDVGFFYSTETADAKIPAIALPPEIAPKAVYTVTILRDAPNADGADKFVAFLLGPDGQSLHEGARPHAAKADAVRETQAPCRKTSKRCSSGQVFGSVNSGK